MAEIEIAFSHIGIQVFELDRMIAFYSEVLDFPVTDRGMLHGVTPIAFLSRDPRDHHQIVLVQMRPESAKDSTVNQISFRLPGLDDLRALRGRLRAHGFEKFRCAMHGTALSVYVFDPEGNQIEMFVDTPWYIPQPCSLPFDLDLPNDEVMARTEAFCREQEGFMPVEEWRETLRARL